MIDQLHSFIHLVFVGFIALFPVVNPVGSAFIVHPYFAHLPRKERVKFAKKVAFYAFCICTVTLFTGHWILELFGLSVPIVQVAGGIMICKIGWQFLSSDKDPEPEETSSDIVDVKQVTLVESELFYPITFPITTGAGTIAVLFTLSARGDDQTFSEYMLNNAALLVSITGMCLLVYVCYINANRFINYMGSRNEKIINRLMAFLIFCVGLQIAVGGITKLIKG